MEPITAFGAAAGAAQLADFTARIFITIFDYLRKVKQAPKKAKDLRDELQKLSTLLDSLKDFLQTFHSNGTISSSRFTFLDDPAKELTKLLNEMEKRVLSQKVEGIGRWKWPFSEKENTELIERMQRFKTDLILVLNIDQT